MLEKEVCQVEDGLYLARGGVLYRLDTEDDDRRKIRVSDDAFQAIRSVQKRMRRLLGGYKPDLSLVADVLLLKAAELEGIEAAVRERALRAFSGECPPGEQSRRHGGETVRAKARSAVA